MIRRPPRSTPTDTLFPYTTLFRASTSSARTAEGLIFDPKRQPGIRRQPLDQRVAEQCAGRPHPARALVRKQRDARFGEHLRSRAIARIAVALNARTHARALGRSEERSVGKEWVSTGRFRWLPYH